jgi:hypothetical protein
MHPTSSAEQATHRFDDSAKVLLTQLKQLDSEEQLTQLLIIAEHSLQLPALRAYSLFVQEVHTLADVQVTQLLSNVGQALQLA